MSRYCLRFYCNERHDRYCCADCRLRRDCSNPCLNHPIRCGLEDKAYVPPKRRGGSGKLNPKK